jgi:hypothetical protein
MNKKQTKHIREIAERLPTVYQQSMSGFTIEEDKMVPHVYNVEINHERRLRKAYERYGLEGIKSYLEMISNLQKQRNENFVQQRDGDSAGEASGDENITDPLALQKESSGDIAKLDQTEESVGA